MLKSPILFIIFNRLDTAKRVFETIRQQQPTNLYIASDAPRDYISGEYEKCEIVRNYIIQNITWECNVHTLFLEKNLGPGRGVSTAINWFFENVEEGIILEHDCLPHPDFFQYCEELLDYHRNNENVMVITGNAFSDRLNHSEISYDYSALSFIWGWATWKRVWKLYNYDIHISDKEIKQVLTDNNYFESNLQIRYYRYQAFLKRNKKINTWDFQLLFAIWKAKGICVIPKINLVSNIGFGVDAVHCKNPNNPLANRNIGSILPIVHNNIFSINKKCDLDYYWGFCHRSLFRYLINILYFLFFVKKNG